MSIRLRESLISVGLLILLAVVLVSAWLLVQGRQLRGQSEDEARSTTRLLVEASRSLLAEGDVLRLARMAERATVSEQVIRILIIDRTGRVIVDTRREAYGTTHRLVRQAVAAPGIRLEEEGDHWTTAAGIRDELGRSLGAVVVEHSTNRLMQARQEARESGLLIALAATALGVGLSFIGARHVTRPLTELVKAMRRVEAGEIESSVPVSGPTEVVEIGQAFNSMVGAVRQRIRNLELLNEMESGLARAEGMASAVDVIRRAADALLHADVRIWLRDASGRRLLEVGAAPEEDETDPVPMDADCALARSYREARMVTIGDDADLPAGSEVWRGVPIQSGMLLALWTPGSSAGVMALIARVGHKSISREERALAWTLAALAAPMLAAALREDMQARAVAALQVLLIPPPPTRIKADVHAMYLPAEEAAGVGGDYYDFDDLGQSRWGIAIGDASGHGLDAARYVTMAKWILRSFIHVNPDPADVLRQTNNVLSDQVMDEKFVTLLYCVWNENDSSLLYASAGHLPALVYRQSTGTVEELAASGLPLSVRRDTEFATRQTQLDQGDILCMYTDGIVEARRNGELFGATRLAATLEHNAHLPTSEIAAAIEYQVRQFTGGVTRDDIALIILKR